MGKAARCTIFSAVGGGTINTSVGATVGGAAIGASAGALPVIVFPTIRMLGRGGGGARKETAKALSSSVRRHTSLPSRRSLYTSTIGGAGMLSTFHGDKLGGAIGGIT